MEDVTLTLAIITLFVWILGIYIYSVYVSDEDLETLLKEYYPGEEIESISKFSIHDKIKYRIPINLYFLLATKVFGVFSKIGHNYFRIIEFKNNNKSKNVDILIRRRIIIRLKEFSK